eukprot:2028493-Alexandrium_andersonii.AAC.1
MLRRPGRLCLTSTGNDRSVGHATRFCKSLKGLGKRHEAWGNTVERTRVMPKLVGHVAHRAPRARALSDTSGP